jgi:hypothetical protein
MAIKYKDLKHKVNTEPLSEDELEMISIVEKIIDDEIVKQFDKNWGEIYVLLSVVNFQITNLGKTRKFLMMKELEKRYSNAGWTSTVKLDDGLDGPNMSGPDYWVLKGNENHKNSTKNG